MTLAAAGILGAANMGHKSQADEKVTDVREDGMKEMGKALKSIKGLISDNGDKAEIAAQAQKIVNNSAKIPTWFPKEAGLGEAAKPVIWEQWDKFEGNAKNLNAQASQLVAAAQNGSDMGAIQTQFTNTGKVCGTCHEDFKNQKD
ncbi:c-type cytochrome [Dongia soli]|uniref:Cytochrome c n=1 Tax=Dongia soli TaxID=600628 RepID=A0ABU5EJS6_9PROT|nr:cytochrome c [Dongia soli]MDY0885575.1 cytochrome c [Dongia soli]